MNYTYRPAWLIVDRPSIFTKGNSLMSLLAKLSPKKATPVDSHSARLAAIAKLNDDIDSALAVAERAGVTSHTVIDILAKKENAERSRLAANLRL